MSVLKFNPSYAALANVGADLLLDGMLASIEEYFEKRLREEEGVLSQFVSYMRCQRVQVPRYFKELFATPEDLPDMTRLASLYDPIRAEADASSDVQLSLTRLQVSPWETCVEPL